MTVTVTGTAQRQAWTEGIMPPTEKAGDGLWSIPVPIPQNPLRYVLVYALEHRRGITIIDAGWNTEEAWTALNDGLEVAGYAVRDVHSVLVTHIHPDHYGLAGRVREASGAWVGLHPADAALIPGRYGASTDDIVDQMRELLLAHGVPAPDVDELTTASFGIREWVDAAEPDKLIEGDTNIDIPDWNVRAIHTPGHSPGHLCFFLPDRRMLLSGDHVLPRITPNITVHAQQEPNPLADFLDSLQRVGSLDVDEVLPAHEWRFTPLRERVDEIATHHIKRLDETVSVLTSMAPATCWQIAEQLEWSRPWADVRGFLRRAAVGETLAHLVYLRSRGRVQTVSQAPITWEPLSRIGVAVERFCRSNC